MKALFQEWQEEMKRLESPYFDYKHPELKKALVHFMNVLSQHIEVNAETLGSLISKALDEAFVLVTDPATFIRNEFAGREQQTYQPKHAKPILKYLKVLNEEFDDFLTAQASGSYAEVFKIADDYFADVDLLESQEILFGNLSEITPITLDELLDEEEFVDIMLFEDDLDEEEPGSEGEGIPEAEDKQPIEEPVDAKDESSETEAAIDQETVEEEVTPDPEPASTLISGPESEPESSTLNDQFSEAKEESLAEKLEKEEQPETIFSSVSVNQKYMFVQELFDGDANTFQNALGEIEHSGSFDDAVEHLVTNYARQYDWDMNSGEVKELLKVIFRRFR